MASKLKKSSVYGLFLTYEIIPTRCRDLRFKQFCLEDIAPAILIILIAHIIIAVRWMLKDKGNPQAQRVGKQHQHSFNHMCLLGSKHQCRSEEGSNAGCPSDGEDHAEQKCREEPHIIGIYKA